MHLRSCVNPKMAPFKGTVSPPRARLCRQPPKSITLVVFSRFLLEVDVGPFLNNFLTFFSYVRETKNILKYSVFVLYQSCKRWHSCRRHVWRKVVSALQGIWVNCSTRQALKRNFTFHAGMFWCPGHQAVGLAMSFWHVNASTNVHDEDVKLPKSAPNLPEGGLWVGQVECTQKKEHVVNLQLDIDMKNIDALSLNSSYTV